MTRSEELSERFCEAFEAMRSDDPEEIQLGIDAVEEAANHPLALITCLALAQDHTEDYIRHQAVLTVRASMKGARWKERDETEEGKEHKVEIVAQFIQCLAHEPQENIRRSLCYAISKLVEPTSYFKVLDHARWALETGEEAHIHSAVMLMNDVKHPIPSNEEEFDTYLKICELGKSLAQAGIESDNVDVVLDSLVFAFQFSGEYIGKVDEDAVAFVEFAIGALPTFLSTPKFSDLVSILGDIFAVDGGYVFAKGLEGAVWSGIVNIFLSEELDESDTRALIACIDDICASDPEEIFADENLTPAIQKIIQMDVEECNLNEHLEMLDCDRMENICMCFGDKPDFIEACWGIIQDLWDNPQGQCVATLVMTYCAEACQEFFEDKLDDMVTMMTEMIASESVLAKDCGMRAIENFVKVFRDVLPDYVDDLENAVFTVFKETPSVELLHTLADIVDASADADNIFEEVFPVLSELLISHAEDFGDAGLAVLLHLIRNSRVYVMENYGDIFTFLQELITAAKDEAVPLLDMAVECVSSLVMKSPDNFIPMAPWFIQTIMEFIGIDDDGGLHGACVNAYGSMLTREEFRELMAETASDMIEFLYEMSGCDMSGEVAKLALMQEEQGGDDDDIEELELPESRLENAGGALMLLGMMLEIWPELISECGGKLVERISELSDSLIPFSVSASMKAAAYTILGMKNGECPDEEIIDALIINILKAVEHKDKMCYADAMWALSTIINAFGLEPFANHSENLEGETTILNQTLESIQYSFDGEMPCMTSGHCPIEVHEILIRIASSIMEQAPAECNEILGSKTEILGILVKFLEDEQEEVSTTEEKVLAISVLRDYMELSETVADNIPPLVLQAALEMCEDDLLGATGFYTFKKFAKTPEIIEPYLEPLMELIDARLSTDKRRIDDNEQMTIDACLGCLSVLVVNIIGDDFDLANWIVKVLKWMPARQDMDENPDIMNLLIWIMDKEGVIQEFGDRILAVFVRLFTSEKEFTELKLDGEAFTQLRKIFTALVGMVPDGQDICVSLCKNKSKASLLQAVLMEE